MSCRFTGRKEAGINENSSYYILTQCEDGAFEAVPVNNWFNFTGDIKYQTLTVDEAEEEYNRREKIVNYFSVMVKKRLQDNKEEEEGEENILEKKSKIASRTANLVRIIKSNKQSIEWFSIECCKTKTEVISLSNHNRCKQHKQPIRTGRKYM